MHLAGWFKKISGIGKCAEVGPTGYNPGKLLVWPCRKDEKLADEAPEKLGRYEIVRAIGKGAMGMVYEGRDPKIGRRVAIKTCRADVMENTSLKNELLVRFEREFQAAGALQHPYIVTIYDVGEDDGMPYIAMEFVEGFDLRQVMENRGKYDVAAMVEIAAKVCEGLHHAHLRGIIHRDVKPANVLITKNGEVKIADFGIARVAGSVLTLDGSVVGTPHYMSPEQFAGDELDGRADLFSVGIILYEMLAGRKPFSGETVSTLMHEVLKRIPLPPSTYNEAVPKALDEVLLKALAKYPDARYPDGEALATALRGTLKDAPRKAATMIGVAKPAPPAPEPPLPRTTGSESTLKPKPAVAAEDDFEHGGSMFWPAIAVAVFVLLTVVAVGMMIRVGETTPGQPSPGSGTAELPAAVKAGAP